jgi:hypothetical protein
MNKSVEQRKESIDIFKSIIMMSLFILSTIQGSLLVLPPKHPTPWMEGNSELRMAGDKYVAGLVIGFLC